MRAYVMTTATVFALLVAAHIWRAMVETHFAGDPMLIVSTLIAAGFTVWGVILLRRPASG